MIKPALFIACVLCCCFSCKGPEAVPPDIISLNKMKLLVWEMEIADQTAITKFTNQPDSLRMEATSLYRQALAKYKTDKQNFYKSLAWYEARPDKMKELFDSVYSYGNRQKNLMYKNIY